MNSQQQALAVIHDEHRALAAVNSAFEHVARDMAQGRLTPDYKLLWSIIYYIDAFPETLHHPKEDQELFPRIRARSDAIDATLDELGRQHASSHVHLDRIKTLLGRAEAGVPGAFDEFSERVAAYVGFHRSHMALENDVVFPKAVEVLSAADWDAIAASFASNRDPLCQGADNADAWFRSFYRSLVALVPEPWGVGPRH